MFTWGTFRFSGTQSIDYKWAIKLCQKRTRWMLFIAFKKQSCFHNSSKLLLYVSERTSIRKCWPADCMTATKSAEQKPYLHQVLTFGKIPYLGATMFSEQTFPSSGFSFCASGIPETFLPSSNLVIRWDNNMLFVHKSWQTKPCWQHCKNILFSKEKDGEVALYHPCSAQILYFLNRCFVLPSVMWQGSSKPMYLRNSPKQIPYKHPFIHISKHLPHRCLPKTKFIYICKQ